MKKSIVIVDLLLVAIFPIMIVSKFVNLPFTNIVQPIFLGLIIIHLIQHWKIIIHLIKGLKKR